MFHVRVLEKIGGGPFFIYWKTALRVIVFRIFSFFVFSILTTEKKEEAFLLSCFEGYIIIKLVIIKLSLIE